MAFQLAQTGLGDRLLRAAQNMSSCELRRFLVQWRAELQHELRTNEHQFLSRCNSSIADNVAASFPKPKTVLSYTNPVTSALPLDHNHVACNLHYSTLDVSRLALLCEAYFQWGESGISMLTDKFRSLVWPGVVTRLMLLNKSTVHIYSCIYDLADCNFRVHQILPGLLLFSCCLMT